MVIARNRATKQSHGKAMLCISLTNATNTTLYTGVTGGLQKRVLEHKEKLTPGFTKGYNINKLVYYECETDVYSVISREQHIKAGSREKKITLIESIHQDWRDLYGELRDCFAALAMTPHYSHA